MAISAGAIVANSYYIQPLLAEIQRAFRLTVAEAGAAAMLLQAGTAAGMFVIVPLGDIRERRRLITGLILGASVSLALFASAQNVFWLYLCAFAAGTSGAIVHLFVPLAAHLSPPEQRGRVVGIIVGALMIGILLARTVSGFIGSHFGWRSVYGGASVLMLALAGLIWTRLPDCPPVSSLRWPELIRSAAALWRTEPVLREAAITSGALFGALSAFWTTLVFFLESPPYGYGAEAAGMFGFVGAVGALCAPLTGHIADRYGARRNVLVALAGILSGFVILALFGRNLVGLVAGILVADVAVQTGHVSNQTRIYAIAPDARGRLNMVYMVSWFIGGSLGAYGGTWSWNHFGWMGVCGFAIAGLTAALAYFWRGQLDR